MLIGVYTEKSVESIELQSTKAIPPPPPPPTHRGLRENSLKWPTVPKILSQ